MEKNNSEEILGTRFWRLVVVGFQKKKPPNRGWNWVCRCDCGNTHIASPNDIRNGKIKSCGCYHREASKKEHKNSKTMYTATRDCIRFITGSRKGVIHATNRDIVITEPEE